MEALIQAFNNARMVGCRYSCCRISLIQISLPSYTVACFLTESLERNVSEARGQIRRSAYLC